MGITGELVRSVFSKSSRSITNQDDNNNVRNNVMDKRRWRSSVIRSYLCGDEFNSVLAEEDSASFKSSEATVTQPVFDFDTDEAAASTETPQEYHNDDNDDSNDDAYANDAAAIIIQSAFRGFQVRRIRAELNNELMEKKQGNDVVEREESSSWESSVGTSLEVQTGNSIEAFHHSMQQKTRATTQASKLKEDWDDSTVSSNISKMRIQNRLEATTRRERALAYAFSQQLRICSKKKQTKWDGLEQPNMGWSWLERWMATRLPESSNSIEDRISKQLETITSDQKWAFGGNELLNVSREEKESCGSNEVALDSYQVIALEEVRGSSKPVKNRFKATKSMSRRKTVPSYQCPKIARSKMAARLAKESTLFKLQSILAQAPEALRPSKGSKLFKRSTNI